MTNNKKFSLANFLWDSWCILSIVGIWPRFIEHRLINTKKISIKVPHLKDRVKIVQFSDLHIHEGVTDSFLDKILRKIKACNPDIILFTGDFVCFSSLSDSSRLKKFLNQLNAPFGCFCILGNHDYDQFISLNSKGQYDVLDKTTGSLKQIFKRLFKTTTLAYEITDRAKAVKPNANLEELLKKTPFRLLKNETVQVKVKNSMINLTGLEEYITGRCDPIKGFESSDANYPSVVMLHNPDGVATILDQPGDVILCGHTHGGQVNLPWLCKKFTLMEQPQFKRGFFNLKGKKMYVNRGVGSVIAFRWFATPEILELTLEG